jgi:hypothetical protein
VARYTAVLLVIVLGVASARMLLCESSCANATRTSAPEACHDDGAGEAPLTQLTNAHSCDHSDVVFTLTSSKVTFARCASSIAVPSYASSPATAQLLERFAHSPPGRTHDARTRAITNLRI